jgi:glycosyltransferase involved in cell wall biosynthesis
VLQSRRNVHYFLFGRGIENLAPLVSSLGLGDRVHLSGFVPMDDVPSVLRSADVFFNPSILEGFSRANVQALACGLPLVVSDVPDDRSLREDYGAKGHRASKMYSCGEVTEQYADVYSRILPN